MQLAARADGHGGSGMVALADLAPGRAICTCHRTRARYHGNSRRSRGAVATESGSVRVSVSAVRLMDADALPDWVIAFASRW